MDCKTLHISTSLLALVVANDKAPEWMQLTPVSKGEITAADGRKWQLDNAEGVIKSSLARGSILVDFNHGTDLAAKSGHESPAAAWIDKIALHGPEGEPGLWGHVERWTEKGDKAVADRQYRFVSPVLLSDKRTGSILSIARCALTNDPALVMTGLFHKQETTLDKDLCAALGLPETASKEEVLAAIKKLGGANTAMCGFEKRVAEAAGIDVTKFTALDETTTIALCAKLKAPADEAGKSELQKQVDLLQKQIGTLTANAAQSTANTEVDAAIKAGKITPAQRPWAIDYCAREPEEFRKYVSAAPAILADGRLAPATVPEDALTPEQKDLCAKFSIKENDFKAELAARKVSA